MGQGLLHEARPLSMNYWEHEGLTMPMVTVETNLFALLYGSASVAVVITTPFSNWPDLRNHDLTQWTILTVERALW